MVGAANTGKTCLVQYLTLESPISSSTPSTPTIGCFIDVKRYRSRSGKDVWIEFLEVGGRGQLNHPKTTRPFYKHFDAILCVFDLTDSSSFHKLDELASIALDYRSEEPIWVVGTRSDLVSSTGFFSTSANAGQSYQNHPLYHRLLNMGAQFFSLSLLQSPDIHLWNQFYELLMEKAQRSSKPQQYTLQIY